MVSDVFQNTAKPPFGLPPLGEVLGVASVKQAKVLLSVKSHTVSAYHHISTAHTVSAYQHISTNADAVIRVTLIRASCPS